ncbi:MAG: DUF1311 domain-containing protein [Halioglobus sp.]|nr:DUF1311 domain-containing protein [Halioglobus sp.]
MPSRTSFIMCALVLLAFLPAQSEAQAGFDCSRSLCGCSTIVDKTLALIAVDKETQKAVAGIELRCEERLPALAATDANGRINTTIRISTSPGCGLGRCREVLAIDPSGRYASRTISFPENTTRLFLEPADSEVAHATDSIDPDPCGATEVAGPITSMVRACAEQKLAAAGANLDAYVQELVAQSSGHDRGTERVAALEKAQRAWRNDRDATCELVYGELFGGSMAPVQRLECKVQETTQRLSRLQRIFSPPDDLLAQ